MCRPASEAIEYLCTCEWKGNGRELENAIERAMALSAEDVLEVADFPTESGASERTARGPNHMFRAAAQQRLSLQELQDLYIEEVLNLMGGNKVQSAKILGVDRKTLYRRAERNARRAQECEEATG